MPSGTIAHQLVLAWLAGLVDGDGCIRIARRAPPKSSQRANPIFSLEVTVGQNCEATLDIVRALLGEELALECGKSTTVGRVAEGKAPTKTLTLRSDKAVKLLRAIRPYLRRKDLEAELGIEFGERVQAVHARRRASGRGLKIPLPPEEIAYREACHQRLSALKPRGPQSAYEGARQCQRAS